MQQLLKMTVFCVSHTQVAVLKLEGVKGGGLGDGASRKATQSQLLLSPGLVLLHATIIHCTQMSVAACYRERRTTPRVLARLLCRPLFPTQLRTSNDYDHRCQFEGKWSEEVS